MATLSEHGHDAKRDLDRAAHSKSMERLARVGLIGKGVVYAIVGLLAVQVATDAGGDTTDKSGALETVARQPFGEVLVVALGVMLALYAIWRLVEAIVGTGDDGAKDWAKRAGYAGRGAIYAFLAFVSLQLAAGSESARGSGGSGGSGGGGSEDAITARVLDWPAGQWIVIAGGLCVLGAAGWNLYRGITRKFEKNWRTEQMSETEERVAGGLGVAGHLARGVTFGLIGFFLIKAAWEYDPEETVGLDGALAKLARGDYGPWLLAVVALGLVCYGLFCFAEARWRDVEPEGGKGGEQRRARATTT